jgi:chloramphenicol 3-O-phosphotransferase
MDVRIPLYEKAATLVVDTSTVTPEEVAALIIKNLPKGFKT